MKYPELNYSGSIPIYVDHSSIFRSFESWVNPTGTDFLVITDNPVLPLVEHELTIIRDLVNPLLHTHLLFTKK